MNPVRYLNKAFEISRRREDERHFYLGAVGIRKDGAIITACNGAPKEPTPEHHAETRAIRKCGRGAILFVARSKANGEWANAKPCDNCERALRLKGVKKVYYTIGPATWGCITFSS